MVDRSDVPAIKEIFEPEIQEIDLDHEIGPIGTRLDGTYLFATGQRNWIFVYCLAASLILHTGLIFALPRLVGISEAASFLKPGEKVTQVRLVEQPQEPNASEKPPENPSAISDRDHTTSKERIPKVIPGPKPPIGKFESFEKRMAALPPSTPEHLEKDVADAPKKEDGPKPASQPKNGRTKQKEHVEQKHVKKDLRQKNIDLRPNPQELARGLSGGAGTPDFYPDGDLEEAVVDINTREDRFFSYLLHLKRKIQSVWTYPSVAAKAGIGGSLTVEFSIANTGELLDVHLLDSSGHAMLDESAIKAIRAAAPYFPFPSRMRAKRLKVRANFIYITQNFFRNIM